MTTAEPSLNAVNIVETMHANLNSSHLPLSFLHNPTWEFLHANYTRNELQKYCSHLGLQGIWTNKEKLIDKLMSRYSSITNSPSTSDATSDRGDEEQTLTELRERFDAFVRETNDNFYFIDSNLAHKDKEIQELKTKLLLAEEKIKTLQEILYGHENVYNQDHETAAEEKRTLLIGDSLLPEIKFCNLQKKTIVRTLPEADMALLRSWVMERLYHPLKKCVIYLMLLCSLIKY